MASVLTALIMFVAGAAAWTGLGWLLLNVAPNRPLALAAAYVFALCAITATAALLVWLVLRPRLPEGRLRSPAGYLAHAMLFGIIVLFGLWLQSLHVLTPIVAVLLIGLYTFLELAVLFGTRGSVELPLHR